MMVQPLNFPVTWFCLIVSIAFAGTDSTSIAELNRMVVRSQKATISGSSSIDSNVILRPQHSATVDGLLADIAGIDLRRTSPAAGKGGGVTLRGLDESRSLILLNGRQLNGAGVMGGDYVDWSVLPTADVLKVDVLRGVKSAEYGNTIGGVINIITRKNMTAPSKTRVNASYGIVTPEHARDVINNRNTGISISHHANILNKVSLDLFADYGKGEPFLRNNYYERTSLGGELSLLLPWEIRASAGVNNSLQKRGFAIANTKGTAIFDPDYPESKESAGGGPGFTWKGGSYYFGDRSYWLNNRTQIDFSLQKELPGFVITALGHINDQDRTEYYYAINDTNRLIMERFAKPEDNTWGCNLIVQQSLGKTGTLKYGTEGNCMRYNSADIRQKDSTFFRSQPEDSDPSKTIKAADRYGVFVQSHLHLGERIEASPGLRYDYYLGHKRGTTFNDTKFHGVSPNAGITVTTWEGGSTSLHGAYAYRFPTCPELYWYYGGYRPSDRRELAPERAVQVELEVSHTFTNSERLSGTAGIRGYYYGIYDYIRTIFGYQPSRLIYNIDKINLSGIEIEASLDLLQKITVRGNYTFQHTQKSGDTYDSSMILTKGLPELPKHKCNLGIEYRTQNNGFICLSMRYVSEREVITGNLAKGNATTLGHLDGFATFRLHGSYPVFTRDGFSAKIKAGIDNLFNVDYSEFPGIPMPGITGTTAVEFSF
ncbi:MAG: TonB-dependent receptor [Chitinispirillaceae bacterium]|nr:TonB-dependent receptor [Chitinispirillaceae bacterium]